MTRKKENIRFTAGVLVGYFCENVKTYQPVCIATEDIESSIIMNIDDRIVGSPVIDEEQAQYPAMSKFALAMAFSKSKSKKTCRVDGVLKMDA